MRSCWATTRIRWRILDLRLWLETPGVPKAVVAPESARLVAVDRAAVAWLEQKIGNENLGAGSWSTQEWVRFLRTIQGKLPLERLALLDRQFRLTDSGNAEIAHEWLLLALKNEYTPADARLESYLTTIGRNKLVLPLYRALVATPAGRLRAQAIYAKARPFYHPLTVESVDKIMKAGM